MGLETATIIAITSAVVGTASYVEAKDAREEASANAQRSAEQQRKAQEVQQAGSAQQAAMERRQQIREERVRRARIMQASTNTGTIGSSSEFGAIGGLNTQLQSNIGQNLGAIQRGQAIGTFSQNAADFNTASQRNMNEATNAQSLFSLSTSIFSGVKGWDQVNKAIE